MAVGLVSVLVAVGILVLVMSMYLDSSMAPNSPQVMKAREDAQQIAGFGSDGLRAHQTITLEPEIRGGKVDNILVTSIVTGGAMESYYGLKKDDCIIDTSMMNIRGQTDPELAKALVLEAYQRKHELTVLRNGEKIKLPQATPAPAAGAPAAQGTSGSGSGSRSDPLQTQLNAIQRAP